MCCCAGRPEGVLPHWVPPRWRRKTPRVCHPATEERRRRTTDTSRSRRELEERRRVEWGERKLQCFFLSHLCICWKEGTGSSWQGNLGNVVGHHQAKCTGHRGAKCGWGYGKRVPHTPESVQSTSGCILRLNACGGKTGVLRIKEPFSRAIQRAKDAKDATVPTWRETWPLSIALLLPVVAANQEFTCGSWSGLRITVTS